MGQALFMRRNPATQKIKKIAVIKYNIMHKLIGLGFYKN